MITFSTSRTRWSSLGGQWQRVWARQSIVAASSRRRVRPVNIVEVLDEISRVHREGHLESEDYSATRREGSQDVALSLLRYSKKRGAECEPCCEPLRKSRSSTSYIRRPTTDIRSKRQIISCPPPISSLAFLDMDENWSADGTEALKLRLGKSFHNATSHHHPSLYASNASRPPSRAQELLANSFWHLSRTSLRSILLFQSALLRMPLLWRKRRRCWSRTLTPPSSTPSLVRKRPYLATRTSRSRCVHR